MTENKLKDHKNVCKRHDYCKIEMPEKVKTYYNIVTEKNHSHQQLK